MTKTKSETNSETLSAASALKTAEEILLAPANLSAERLLRKLGDSARGADLADIYVQRRITEGWSLEEGEVKTGEYAAMRGMGLRAVRGETTAFAASDAVSETALADLREVAQAAKTHGRGHVERPRESEVKFNSAMYDSDSPIESGGDAEKIALLKRLDSLARAADSKVENVMARLASSHDVVLIARADGVVCADIRPMIRVSLEAIYADGDKRETGFAGGGGRVGLEFFDDAELRRLANVAVEEARLKAHAAAAPAGRMPVVLGPGWAGILLHEAVGHGLEGDFNRKGQSAFSGRVGERVAPRGVTIVDNGVIPGRRGSLTVDDEGVATRENVLIEDGVLRGYMQDLANARLTGVAPTGNGRRESYGHAPMPRMTNTYMRRGRLAAEEIVGSVRRGLYAADFSGGQVDITNGNFVFVSSKARLIEDGKLGAVVKGATLTGNGPEVMTRMSMVGDDWRLDPGVGTCGKDGQWVPVGVGQPTVKVDEITVGGTAV